jgi:hypothetical protein
MPRGFLGHGVSGLKPVLVLGLYAALKRRSSTVARVRLPNLELDRAPAQTYF